MKVMNLLHYTENTLDTKQMEDIFAHYKRTMHALFYVARICTEFNRNGILAMGSLSFSPF